MKEISTNCYTLLNPNTILRHSLRADFFEITDGCGAFRNDCKRAGYTQVMVRVFVPIVTLRSAGCHVDNSPYLA